jgi:hypothetical protein
MQYKARNRMQMMEPGTYPEGGSIPPPPEKYKYLEGGTSRLNFASGTTVFLHGDAPPPP